MSEEFGPLRGIKVVEFAQIIAGPLAGGMLADLGADVVHVEQPETGDTARAMGPARDGIHLWWKVSGRNKRSVTLDLRTPAGREMARRLVRWADIVICTFRLSTLQKWGLDWPGVHAANPRAIMLQISGYGATSSLADAPGFGKMGEARSGVVHLTGQPDGPPVHTGFSQGDAVAGLIGAFAVSAALHRRDTDPDYDGEWIDLALFEPLFRLIEWQVIVYDQLGIVPARAGNQLAVAPAAVINTYLSANDDWITVTSATARSVRNIARLLGLPEEDYRTPAQQNARRDALDAALRDWVQARSTEDALAELAAAEVVATKVFNIADIMADRTFAEREDIVSIEDPELGKIRMPAVIPRFHREPGRVWRAGTLLGADNDLVFGTWLGLSPGELDNLKKGGVI